MSDALTQIQASIARCKERIAQIEAGERGQIPEGSRHAHPGRAYEAQLHAQRQALERFEAEFVQAMLAEHKWSPRLVIERMEQRPAGAPAQPVPEVQIVRVGDETRGKLQSLLENTIGTYIPRSKLTELLSK